MTNFPSLNKDYDALILLGSCYHYLGNDEDNINLALDCFLKANKIKPRNSFANNLIGYFYMVKNKPYEAVFYFRDAVNFDNNNVSIRLNLVKLNSFPIK